MTNDWVTISLNLVARPYMTGVKLVAQQKTINYMIGVNFFTQDIKDHV